MDKLRMKSLNTVDGNVAKIAALFPNCVTERKGKDGIAELAIDFDKLRAELSKDILEEDEERYQFTWPDKRAASRLANTAIDKTLRPDLEASKDFWNTDNLYIEGDNLDVLKVLRENYLGKIKMIYIDPPYNTGNDFVYNDDFAQGKEGFEATSGIYDEDGNQILDPMQRNTESNGRFHTDWLNMIYPRLKVARDLLSDDGVIFISIDDNEEHNLKKVCDEVFGSINFLNTFAWVNNLTGRQISGKGAAKTWEPILVYAKNSRAISTFDIDIAFAKNNMPDAYKGFNKDLREDEHGAFAIGDTLYNHNRKFNEETRPNLVFSIFYNPDTEEIKSGDIGASYPGFVEILPHTNSDGVHKYHAWRWSRPKVDSESFNLIVLPTSKGGYEIYTRIRDFNTTTLKDIVTNISNGDSEVQRLFDNRKYFDYPKSVALLYTLIGFSDNESIILDFFSGSATTAHAVMKLNAEDGGKRKFIMVQLPEVTDEKSEAHKAGYENICQIGEERIRRAGENVKEEAGDKAKDLDVGFRVLKLDSSNMEDVFYTPEDFNEQHLFNYVDNVKSDRTPLDLLFQVLPELGIELSAKIEERDVNGKKVFFVDGTYLIATFDTEVNESTVTEIAKMKPDYFVMRDASAANDNVLDNFEQIFKHYSPDTIRKIL
ncbi:MAG: site-specific DNA-methyltransferase [Muribaculaceae bacterium]|nr:site-specific DNA-methyltransferase [Muribaculaceae bacterium]